MFCVDIIGLIANHCGLDDIVSFLLTSKETTKLINQELLHRLSNVYGYPYTNSFNQLIRFSSYSNKQLCKLAIMTDDSRIFRKYNYDNVIHIKDCHKYGSLNIFNYLYNPE